MQQSCCTFAQARMRGCKCICCGECDTCQTGVTLATTDAFTPQTGVLSTSAHVGVCVTQVFETSAYTVANTLAAKCAHAFVYAPFVH